jgi:hypothetical protein
MACGRINGPGREREGGCFTKTAWMTTREMPRNCGSGRNCKQFRLLGNLLHNCKQTKSIIRVDVLRIYFTIRLTVSHCESCHEICLFEFSLLPSPCRFCRRTRNLVNEASRGTWKNLEESRPC